MPTLANPSQTLATLTQAPLGGLVAATCQSHHVPFMFVGGVTRDVLMGQSTDDVGDWDIVVPANQVKLITNALAHTLESRWIPLDEAWGIYRVLVPGNDGIVKTIDVASQMGDSFEADLRRRDLTINAIGWDGQSLLDPTNGLNDLTQSTLRMVSEGNLLDDPLRLLRVFRFAATTGFSHIESHTYQTIVQYSDRVLRAAPERIHYEWMRLLSAPKCHSIVASMADSGMLEHLFPEFSPLRQVPANAYHHLGLWDHTLELLHQLECHWDSLPDNLRALLLSDWNPFISRLAVCRLACLCHDIGKPITMVWDEPAQRYRFLKHEIVGEDLTWGIGQRARWGQKLTQALMGLVRWHLYPAQLLHPEVTDKARRKFFNRIDAFMPELIALALADRYSAQGPMMNDPTELGQHKADLLALWDAWLAHSEAQASLPHLLTGHDVMTLLSLSPGPRVGELLTALRDAQLNGDIQTTEQAKAWLINQ